MSDINDYLATEAARGKRHSQGHFTIDLLRAYKSAFQKFFPVPEYAILKIVQALTRLGTTRIDVSTSSSEMWVEARIVQFQWDDFCRTLERNPLVAPDSAMRDLAIGVATLLGTQDSVRVTWVRGQQSFDIIGGNQPVPLPSKRDGIYIWCNQLAPAALLLERATFSPSPIYLNGTPVKSRPKHTLLLGEQFVIGNSDGFTSQIDGQAQFYFPGNDPRWNKKRCRVWLRRAFALAKPGVAIALKPGAVRELDSYSVLSYDLVGPSYLHLVRHGVTLEPIKLSSDFGCCVVLGAPEVDLDVSTLKAVEGLSLDVAKRKAAQLLRELRASVTALLGSTSFELDKEKFAHGFTRSDGENLTEDIAPETTPLWVQFTRALSGRRLLTAEETAELMSRLQRFQQAMEPLQNLRCDPRDLRYRPRR